MPKLTAADKAAPTPAPDLGEATVAAKKAVAKKAAAPPKASLLSAAAPLDDQDEFVNSLYCGDNGTGKTTDLMTMANLGPIIVVNAEGGVKRRALQRMGVNTANIVTLPPQPELLTFEYLEDLYWEIKGKLADGNPDGLVGVVWDSVTEIHSRLLRNVVRYQYKRAEDRGQSRIKDASPGDMLNQFFIDLSDYGVMTGQVIELLKLYRDLPIHFGVSALLRRDKDDDGKVVYRPAVTPALRNELMGLMDVVAVTTVDEMPDGGEDEYRGLFRPAGKFRGKDRFKVLPKRLIDPTFERVYAYVAEELDVDSDAVMQEAKARREAFKGTATKQAVEQADDAEADDDADADGGDEE